MELSGIDISHIVRELHPMVNAKIQKAYGNDDYPLVLDIYGYEYRYMYIVLPHMIGFSNNKAVMPIKPPGFVERSRKHLQGLRIKSISQYGLDRIIILELEGRIYRKVIIELFSKGNIIICDENDRMLTLYRQESYASRTVRTGRQYDYPPKNYDISLDNNDSFYDSLKEHDDKHLLNVVAQMGFGGYNAERILKELLGDEYDAKKIIGELDEHKIRRLYDIIMGYVNARHYDKASDSIIIVPDAKEPNSIIRLLAMDIVSKPEDNIVIDNTDEDRKERIISMQEERSKKLAIEAEEFNRKGSIIYERYDDIKRALEYARDYKEKNGSLKGIMDVWPKDLPKLVRIGEDGKTFEIDL
ncbi:MAG: NFACT family protein [Candidatus Woesearchaeota archaeon]